jgi:phosphohistidine phosphatase
MADEPTEPSPPVVYLVQHGEAEPKAKDPERPLTGPGRETVERVAAWAAGVGVRANQIRHSGKLRAEQTAALFAEKLEPHEGVAARSGLGPNDDVQPVAEELAECTSSVMIVGHLPFLSRLAGALLADDPERPLIRFRNGGLVGLVREEDRWQVGCVVPPEMAVEG